MFVTKSIVFPDRSKCIVYNCWLALIKNTNWKRMELTNAIRQSRNSCKSTFCIYVLIRIQVIYENTHILVL